MNPKRVLPLLLLACALRANDAYAQAAPINGTASVSGAPTVSTVAVDKTVTVRVAVNCTGVTGTTGSGTSPVVLGAFQISATFDKALLRFESASGGTSSGFTGAPTATNPATANSTGKVTITGAQTSSTTPTGNVSVATLTFTTLAPGSAAISTSAVSLSSAFVPPSYGPASIPSTPGNSVVTIAALPGAISNPAPANGSTAPEPVTLSWTASPNTTSYDVSFGTPAPQFLVNTTSTSVQVATQPGTTYQWRVVSKNAVGTKTSSTYSFTTAGDASCAIPATPQISGPSSAASDVPFVLTWTAVNGATSYSVDESTDAGFANSTTTKVDAPVVQLSVTKVVAVTATFYYRVVANNESGSCNQSGQASAAIAVVVQPPDVPTPLVRIIPAVMSGHGASGSFFRTALQLHNPSTGRISGLLRFHPAGVAGSDADPSLAYALEPGQTLYHADLVAAIGTQGLGSLDVVVEEGSAPRAVVRVFNDGGEAGTTGMFEPMLRAEEALTPGQTATLLAPPDPIAARYNVGIRTLEPTVAILELRTSTGTLLTTVTKSFPATWFEHNSAASLLGMTPGASDTIVIRLESGRAFVYGAATDNRTQDPSLELARP